MRHLILLALTLAGCAKATEADCTAVFDKAMKFELADAPAAMKRDAATARADWIARCAAGTPARVLTCYQAAETREAWLACQ